MRSTVNNSFANLFTCYSLVVVPTVTVELETINMITESAELLGWSAKKFVEDCVRQIVEESRLPADQRRAPALCDFLALRRAELDRRSGGIVYQTRPQAVLIEEGADAKPAPVTATPHKPKPIPSANSVAAKLLSKRKGSE